ncbi:MAG: hypothetical protein KBO60_27530, partial [Achromobacter sp.]|nr:hypothetical protein [Achromobacter sp.]
MMRLQQHAAQRVQLDVALALRHHARRRRRRRAFDAQHLLPARRQHLDVAAELRAQAGAAIHGEVALVQALRAFGVGLREQRRDGAAAAQIAAGARTVLLVVFAAALAQLGEVQLARVDVALLGRQRVQRGARAVLAAVVAMMQAQPVDQMQLAFLAIVLHQVAALA